MDGRRPASDAGAQNPAYRPARPPPVPCAAWPAMGLDVAALQAGLTPEPQRHHRRRWFASFAPCLGLAFLHLPPLAGAPSPVLSGASAWASRKASTMVAM